MTQHARLVEILLDAGYHKVVTLADDDGPYRRNTFERWLHGRLGDDLWLHAVFHTRDNFYERVALLSPITQANDDEELETTLTNRIIALRTAV